MNDEKMQDLILRALFDSPGHEAVLLPSLFNPPIMLSNIFRVGNLLKSKGYVSAPNRRLGGWHYRLLEPGKAYCQAGPAPAKTAATPIKKW
jgi:hypothetical protein